MSAWKRWRPYREPEPGPLKERMQSVARDWSAAWFGASARFGVAIVETGVASPREPWALGSSRLRYRGRIETVASVRAWRRAATLALSEGGAHDGIDVFTGAVVDALLRRMQHDLLRRVDLVLFGDAVESEAGGGVLQADDLSEWPKRVAVEFSTSDASVRLRVYVDAAALPSEPSRVRPRELPPLMSRLSAISATPTEVVAMIGRATVRASDLLSLRRGDVLVTTCRLDQAADVWVSRTRLTDVKALPCQVGGQVAIQLSKQVSGALHEG